MFSLAPFATLVVAALSVSALPVPTRNHKTIAARAAPAGWAHGYLESYDVYHDRYIALSCQGRHGDSFFESCCHPLLATETLEGNREAQCNPANLPAASSAAAVEVAPTSSAAVAPTSSAAAAPAATSAAPVEEEEEECEVEDESSSAAAPAQTTVAAAPAATTSAAAVQTSAEVQAAVVPTTTAAAPAPTTTAAAPAATTAAAAPSGDMKTGGFATYFLQNGNPGACGNYNADSVPLVAITAEYYGGDAGQASSNCGRYVNIERDDGSGRSVTAIVADLCPTCVNGNSLDLSEGAFSQIASTSEGMVGIKWSWA